ncbi:2OG-Fe(II) oxygenase (plasmid) [Rhizobium lusitanum]|uniref:2OG-Fe(II) oxygenase n=1 Tax=Rhizobium lusitanum TaxID=293958 RepID=UPI001617EE7A|nr:2OG-Fe(II) oxygenase [Rhizobium lusitanum]QND44434.1 2OG-Fe(II) oxygenase [Rhizobium lusitanum]
MEVLKVDRRDAADVLTQGNAAIIDDFLDAETSNEFSRAAIESWKRNSDPGTGWNLCIKSGDINRRIPTSKLASNENIKRIFDACSFDPFRYWYYSCFASPGKIPASHSLNVHLIKEIETALLKAGLKEICDNVQIDVGAVEPRFSITSFDPLSFIDPHSDFLKEGKGHYIITVLYYLAGPSDEEYGGELVFSRTVPAAKIKPIQNRLVLFRPSADSIHHVVPNSSSGNYRLAFSGWFAQP